MKKLILLFVVIATTLSATAQKKFSYNDIMEGKFSAKSVYGFRSMKDGKTYSVKEGNTIAKYSYATGKKLQTIESEVPFVHYDFSADEKQILFTSEIEPIYRHSYKANYWIYDIETKKTTKLSESGKQEIATFSPDGSKVAFVRDNNLFYYDIATASEHQITTDGKFNYIINGKPDWVYEEEFALYRGYEWAPDSKGIAFIRFNEERVKEFDMTIYTPGSYPDTYTYKYPRAGELNSIVSVHTYNLSTKSIETMDIGKEEDIYIPRIRWAVNSSSLLIFRLNRLQNQFDILMSNPSTGESKVVYSESDDRYINNIGDNTITLLEDGDKYIVQSERDGYNHLYLYSLNNGLISQITKGQWEVTELLGVNRGTAYFLSTETSPIKRNLYSIKLNGKGKKRITNEEGNYRISFSNDFSYYISYFSNSTTPNTVTLHRSSGKAVRVLEDNAALKATIKEYQLPEKEFFSFTNSENVLLNGYMIKPHNFNPEKRYPVFMTQYSGPGSQQVLDNWGMSWEQVLVQEGYILVCVDGRGTGGRGEEFRKSTYGKLGKLEEQDQVEAAQYLSTLSYVDSERIGIYGWSYGGYMALNCILGFTGSEVFKAAIAVAPVTTWRFYDTIYTERYNGLPQDNGEGYDKHSPLWRADRLKGKLLIAHGTADDNVHVQNTMEMIYALQAAGKQFEMAIYPNLNHSMLPSWMHRHNLMIKCIEFIKREL